MRRVLIAFSLLILLGQPQAALAQAQPTMEHHDGGFTGFALITADPDWRREWDTETSHTPQFRSSRKVTPDQIGHVLVFFSGATPAGNGYQVLCAVRITAPSGERHDFPRAPCTPSPASGPADSLHLVELDIGVGAERGDPAGLFTLEIGLTDAPTRRHVDLKVSVEFDPTP